MSSPGMAITFRSNTIWQNSWSSTQSRSIIVWVSRALWRSRRDFNYLSFPFGRIRASLLFWLVRRCDMEQRLQISSSFRLAGRCRKILSGRPITIATAWASSWAWFSANTRRRKADSCRVAQLFTRSWLLMDRTSNASNKRPQLSWSHSELPMELKRSCSSRHWAWQLQSGAKRFATNWIINITNAGNSWKTTFELRIEDR